MNKKYLQFIVLLLTLLFISSFVSAEIFDVNLVNNATSTTTPVVQSQYEKTFFEVNLYNNIITTQPNLQPQDERTVFDVNLIKTKYSQSQTNAVYVSRPPQTTSSPSRFGVYLGDEVLKVCSCSQYRDLISIKNTENTNVAYTLSSNIDYVRINPSTFQLRSGDVQIVELLINAPCNELEKNLEINVKLAGDGDATLTKKIVFAQCQNLNVKLKSDTNSIDPCEAVDYNLYVKNVGLFTEEYSVSSNYDDFMNYSARTIRLNASQEGIINATYSPSCGLYGDTVVNFSVSAKNNQLKANVEHDLTINKLYDYSLDVNNYNLVCEEYYNPIEIKLTNNVKTPNTYNLELIDAPSFVKLSTDTIDLDSKESKTITLNFVPENAKLGYYNFTLKATSKYGNMSIEKEVILDVNDCYKPQITILDADKTFCAQKDDLTVNVKNSGLFEERIALVVYPNPGMAKFNKDYLTLKPGEESDVTLKLDPEDKTKTYGILVQAVLDNGIMGSYETKDINVISQWSCHEADVAKETYSIRRDTQDSAVLKIKNEGLESGKYYLSLEPKDFWVSLNEKVLTLDAGQTKEVLLLSNHTNQTPFGAYALNLTIQYDHSFKYTKNIIVKLNDKPIYVKAYNSLSVCFANNPCPFISTPLVIVIIILAIIASVITKSGWLKKKQFIAFVIILLLILSILLWIIYAYKGGPYLNKPIDYSNASLTHYIWAQDNQYEFDKASFVSDPDFGDIVNLSLRKTSDYVNVSITNDTIIYTPNRGWSGVTKVSFTALDNHGAVSKSPNIILEVVKRDKHTLYQAYDKLCLYINWVLLLIAFILLAIIGYKKMRVSFNQRRAIAAAKKNNKKKRS